MIDAINKQSLVFFGNEKLSSATDYDEAPILRALLENGYEIEALIIKNQKTQSRRAKRLAISGLARKYGVNIVETNTGDDLAKAITTLKARLAILASFGLVLSKQILQHFPLGVINVHPSLLPAHRGATPIESAILKGDAETGVSLMKVGERLDAGAIYAQERLAIGKGESKLELTQKLGELGAAMLVKNLPLILQQQLQPQPQTEAGATYAPAIVATDVLNFKQHSADYLQHHIRAFNGCPNNKFSLNDRIVEIKLASVAECAPDQPDIYLNGVDRSIRVRCQYGCLKIDKLQPAGRNEMSAADFVNGFYREIPVQTT